MNGGARLFTLFILLVVNLSFFTEVDSAIGPPWTWPTHPYRPGRSVPSQEVRARRHATAMDLIIAPPEKIRLVREKGPKPPMPPHKPRRSVPNHEVRAKRHASAMVNNNGNLPPGQVRLVRGGYFYLSKKSL
ncbi:unnamed protein product [Meloidogyne enterolobii]|uniref:Uncharacterized protein n=1 Tax=Meloidogyne enterolobii TaxID=390850 RepID=A0ACB0ZFM5_MELEN